MKKLIDIPDEIVKDLKKMAIDADKDLKNFIQDHLVLLVRGENKYFKMEQIFQAKWKIGEDTKDFPIRTKIIRVIDDGINEAFELEVCDVLPSVRKKQHVKLIASAPDLLRACNFALQGIKNGQVDELTIKILEDAISSAVNFR